MCMFALLPEYSKSFLWHILHKKRAATGQFSLSIMALLQYFMEIKSSVVKR